MGRTVQEKLLKDKEDAIWGAPCNCSREITSIIHRYVMDGNSGVVIYELSGALEWMDTCS